MKYQPVSLKTLCSKKLLKSLLKEDRSDEYMVRDVLIHLPTPILEYLDDNILDYLIDEDLSRVFYLSFITRELLCQRNYTRRCIKLEDVCIRNIIRYRAFITNTEIIDTLSPLRIGLLILLRNSLRKRLWVRLVSSIIRKKNLFSDGVH